MSLREQGYFGIFAADVVSKEEFPEDFSRYQRRQFRLVQADIEILLTQMLAFLSNKNVSLVERVDLLARTMRIPSQSLTLLFILLAFPLLPLANSGVLSVASLNATFGSMSSPALVAITLLTASAPLFPFLVHMRRRPLEMLELIFKGITLHYSFLVLAVVSSVAYVVKGQAVFVVTGAREVGTIQPEPRIGSGRFLQRLNADSPLVTIIEVGFDLLLGYVGTITGSLVFIGIALILLLSPAIRRFGWQNRALSLFVYLPPVLMVAALAMGYSGGLDTESQYLALSVLSVLLF
jgi:hypothetical protein